MGPVSYFEKNCARCHGPHGYNYDPQALAKLTDAKLRQFVKDMSFGAGAAPLKGPDLDAQVAYHRSLIANKPFVAILGVTNGVLRGQAWGADAVWVGNVKAVVAEDGSFQAKANESAKVAFTQGGKAEVVVGKELFNFRTPLNAKGH